MVDDKAYELQFVSVSILLFDISISSISFAIPANEKATSATALKNTFFIFV
jgi:hypothetical protein